MMRDHRFTGFAWRKIHSYSMLEHQDWENLLQQELPPTTAMEKENPWEAPKAVWKPQPSGF